MTLQLKGDKEFILRIFQQYTTTLVHATDELKNDKEFILKLVKQNGYALQNVPEHFKNDKEVVLAAVKQTGKSIWFASTEMKKDKEIASEAVRQHADALWYESEKLKNETEVDQNETLECEDVQLQKGNDHEYVSHEVKKAAVTQHGQVLPYVPNAMNVSDRVQTRSNVMPATQSGQYVEFEEDNQPVSAAVNPHENTQIYTT